MGYFPATSVEPTVCFSEALMVATSKVSLTKHAWKGLLLSLVRG